MYKIESLDAQIFDGLSLLFRAVSITPSTLTTTLPIITQELALGSLYAYNKRIREDLATLDIHDVIQVFCYMDAVIRHNQ